MTKQDFKLNSTAAERFARDVVEERENPAGLRKAVVKVLGMTQRDLSDMTGSGLVTVNDWINNSRATQDKVRERITAALTIAYIKKYDAYGRSAIPPFDNL